VKRTKKEDETVDRKNIEFAKNLFVSWDDDGSGTLEANEIIKPLIQLGLAPDSNFARKLIDSLDHRSKEEKEKTDFKLILMDFVKIFKSSQISEQLLGVLQREGAKRLNRPVSSMPIKRHDHPTVGFTQAEVLKAKNQPGKLMNLLKHEKKKDKKVSISMLTDSALVEIPIEVGSKGTSKGTSSRMKDVVTDGMQVILHTEYEDVFNQKRVRTVHSFR
jgi:hypothetical protein